MTQSSEYQLLVAAEAEKQYGVVFPSHHISAPSRDGQIFCGSTYLAKSEWVNGEWSLKIWDLTFDNRQYLPYKVIMVVKGARRLTTRYLPSISEAGRVAARHRSSSRVAARHRSSNSTGEYEAKVFDVYGRELSV